MAISFGKEDCQQQVINYSCILQGFFFFFLQYSCMICVEKQEEKKQPGLGEVLVVVVGLS